MFINPHASQAQISKGNQILINRGVELQGLVQWADIFALSNYVNINYTSVNFGYESAPALLGPAPGFPWSRWVSDPTQMPPQIEQGDSPDETPYTSQLFSLELGDELNLNDGPTRTNEINWINSARASFPNTLLYINNFGGQVSDPALGDLLSKGPPDMIFFDSYPFQAQYNTSYSNSIGPAFSWPFTSWLGDLWRYRQWGMNTGIPMGTYMQTFHSVEDYDSIVYRNPSPSELRFNNFVALAFNAKVLTGFVYNAGATSLFNILPNGYSGDTFTNALYVEQTDVNHRAQILGRTLACLKPLPDMHNPADTTFAAGSKPSANPNFPDGATTGILILKGNPSSTNPAFPPTAEPIGFVDDPPLAKSASWWESQNNDPYLAGWAVTNKGVNNSGLAGQVFISWFKVIDESLDGPTYSNEVYMMVVNGLTATNGTAADCLQEIRLNFLTALTNIVMLDPETGLLSTNTLPTFSGRHQLVLNLNGGDAALFKFSDGAPFVGQVNPGPAHLSAQMQAGHCAVTIQGTPLARYRLQSSPTLKSANWTTISSVLLTNSTSTLVDTSPANASGSMFYRVIGVP